ncbi:hypothetical protein CYLTODRAFT_461809, partial [Cylindrobasidium torrendii FP15055 ss-10]
NGFIRRINIQRSAGADTLTSSILAVFDDYIPPNEPGAIRSMEVISEGIQGVKRSLIPNGWLQTGQATVSFYTSYDDTPIALDFSLTKGYRSATAKLYRPSGSSPKDIPFTIYVCLNDEYEDLEVHGAPKRKNGNATTTKTPATEKHPKPPTNPKNIEKSKRREKVCMFVMVIITWRLKHPQRKVSPTPQQRMPQAKKSKQSPHPGRPPTSATDTNTPFTEEIVISDDDSLPDFVRPTTKDPLPELRPPPIVGVAERLVYHLFSPPTVHIGIGYAHSGKWYATTSIAPYSKLGAIEGVSRTVCRNAAIKKHSVEDFPYHPNQLVNTLTALNEH